MIKNKKILIIGSGFSALDLKYIPDDVVVFICKRGIKLLLDNNLSKKIDLFAFTKNDFIIYPIIKELISKVKIKKVLLNVPRCLKKQKELRKNYNSISKLFSPHSFLSQKFIKPFSIKQIAGNTLYRGLSIGLYLLEYALYYKAKEIYLIGIDLGKGGYFWDTNKTNLLFLHEDIDNNFLNIVSKKYKNIYSLSKNSPITKYFPYVEFK